MKIITSALVIFAMMFPTLAVSMAVLRVASWNLLAQTYISDHQYPWARTTSPECLEWTHRKSLIVNRLLDDKELKADIICLQEVQVDLFPDLLRCLSPTFDGAIQNVTKMHNVATAVLVRRSCPLTIRRLESRSRALIATLEDRSRPSSSHVYVCSVHLDADQRRTDSDMRQFHQSQRLCQLRSLLKRIGLQCKRNKSQMNEASIIIAGDFNMLRNNPLHSSLANGSLTPQPILLTDAYLEAERHRRTSIPSYPNYLEERNLSHRLVKTYRGGMILDYIYTSDAVRVLDTLLCHPRSSTKGREQWPCADHPSDHVPIGIDMKWN